LVKVCGNNRTGTTKCAEFVVGQEIDQVVANARDVSGGRRNQERVPFVGQDCILAASILITSLTTHEACSL
jgi:hypothetical protein